MTNKELRIGNLVYGVSDRIEEVIYILPTEVNTAPPKLKQADFLHKIDEIQPIPLTDEWFIKWGFFKDGEYWSKEIDDYKYCFRYRDWAKNWAFYQEFTDSPFIEDDGKKYPISFDIEHVHQLQNLWFALLHKEIEENED